MKPAAFLRVLEEYYRANARQLPWRVAEAHGDFDAYKILVSEVMLQQTQVSRVTPKFQQFLAAFPDVQVLAAADLPSVLALWSGLGYNRRAKYLWQSAKVLDGIPEPWTYEALVALPGIGHNTAAAVLTYSYNLPMVFVETNIRTVLIHHYFNNKQDISDKEILQVLSRLVPWKNVQDMSPRIFYWSMMDYGSYLKATAGNLSRASKAYTKQSAFQGSKRQIRGQIIKSLLDGPLGLSELKNLIPDDRLEAVLKDLSSEKLVMFQGKTLMLYNKSIKP